MKISSKNIQNLKRDMVKRYNKLTPKQIDALFLLTYELIELCSEKLSYKDWVIRPLQSTLSLIKYHQTISSNQQEI